MFMLIYWPSCTFFGDCLSWFPYKTYQVFSMCSKKREMIIENGSGELTLRCLYRHSLRIICKNRLHYGTTPFPWSNHPTSRYLLIIKCNYCLKPHCLSKCFRFVYRVPEQVFTRNPERRIWLQKLSEISGKSGFALWSLEFIIMRP